MFRARWSEALLGILIGMASSQPVAAQAPDATAFGSRYKAADGFLPNQPQWTLSGASGTSLIQDGKLTISTLSDGQNQAYLQTPPLLSIPLPDPLIVEARVKLVSGSAAQLDRAPVGIGITTAPNVGVVFFIDTDRIFLTQGQLPGGSVIGSTAAVDTNDDFHTYRIEIHAGIVEVSYDGAPTLTGNTYVGADDHGPVERIFWGEGSSVAHGVSEWEFFRHNARCSTACVDELAAAAQQIGELQAQVDALTGQNELLQNRIDELQGQVNALTLQNGALQGQVASLTNQNATLQGQVSTLTQQNAALTNTVESLAHTLLGLPADAGVVALLRERTRAEIDRAIAQVGAADRRVRRAERHFGLAVAAQEAGTFRTAVRQFRAAFTIAHAILN